MRLLSVKDLRVSWGATKAVDGLSFDLEAGRALGIVGESGSGKSATAAALLGLHRDDGNAVVSGEITVADVPVLTAPMDDVRKLRGSRIAMIFQDPLSSLDPYYRIGDQIGEVYRLHTGAGKREARARAIEVLERVHLPNPAKRVDSFPHELSGGMRQRALIAMALSCKPDVLIADEPTTALDVTVQAQILDLLNELRRDLGMALVLVTHDLGVVAGTVDDVLVMSKGRDVERGPVGSVLRSPTNPYTQRLLSAIPRIDVSPSRPTRSELSAVLKIKEVTRDFGSVRAVDAVSLEVLQGETLGIVGESGSGKTTLARMMVGLVRPSDGHIEVAGKDLARLRGKALRVHRRTTQMVFQDPLSSLNPRHTIGSSIAEPLRAIGTPMSECRDIVADSLQRVGLDSGRANAYPHEFSGGQRQRIGLARALAAKPSVLVCDEPVSALDVTTQAQVLELLDELQRELGLTIVFVSHDLAVVRQISDRIAVMRQGEVVELAEADQLYDDPQDEYTRALLGAVPTL